MMSTPCCAVRAQQRQRELPRSLFWRKYACVRRGDPDPQSPLQEAQKLATSLQELNSLATLAVARAEAAWLLDDRESALAILQPVYNLSRQSPDARMDGELAVWLFRLGALGAGATEFAKPCALAHALASTLTSALAHALAHALEIAGQWQAAAESWKKLGCAYEHATLLAFYGGEAEKREALTIFESLGAAARAIRRQFRAEGVK